MIQPASASRTADKVYRSYLARSGFVLTGGAGDTWRLLCDQSNSELRGCQPRPSFAGLSDQLQRLPRLRGPRNSLRAPYRETLSPTRDRTARGDRVSREISQRERAKLICLSVYTGYLAATRIE